MSKEEIINAFNAMAEMTINDIDKEQVKTYDDIKIDNTKSKVDKILKFINDVGNPYFSKYNGIIVKSTYAKNNISMQECLLNSISRKIERVINE